MKKISQVTGINEATVASTHRYLRDAGLITKGGRGTSSAKMAASDAANLLISLLAATVINDSPEVVERYGNLMVRKRAAVSRLKNIDLNADNQTFATCVQKIFDAFLSGDLAEAVSNVVGESLNIDDLDYRNIDAVISVYRPEPRASVRIDAIVGTDDELRAVPILSLDFERAFRPRGMGHPNIVPAFSREEMLFDFGEQRQVGVKTLISVAKLLGEDK